MLKKIITISSIVLMAMGLLALIAFSYHLQSNEYVNTVIINIDHNNHVGFLQENEIIQLVNRKDTLLSCKMVDLDIKSIENQLMEIPYIEKADCYGGLNGGLFITIKERNPVVRVYEKDNESYYIDEQGYFFPVKKHNAPRVIIANGYFNDNRLKEANNIYDSIYTYSPLKDLYRLVMKIRSDEFLNEQISQIYYNSRGDWELIPELGGHIIKLGQLNNLDEKLENLIAFYRNLSQHNGWDDYEIINLTFNNQIVCTKK